MIHKNKICLNPSQEERLMTDTAKLAVGDDTDICPTVREMYEKNVKKGKKKAKTWEDKTNTFIESKIKQRISRWIDSLL